MWQCLEHWVSTVYVKHIKLAQAKLASSLYPERVFQGKFLLVPPSLSHQI